MFVLIARPNTTPMEAHQLTVPKNTTNLQAITQFASAQFTPFPVGTVFYAVDEANATKYTLGASLTAG